MNLDFANNMDRLKELTKTVVPYDYTLNEYMDLIEEEGKRGILITKYKTPNIVVLEGRIDKGYVHRNHFHEQWEILSLVSGKVMVDFGKGKEVDLEIDTPMLVPPFTSHIVNYLEDAVINIIVIPTLEVVKNVWK